MKLTFSEWMEQLNAIVRSNLGGFTTEDISDMAYHDMFDDGCTPAEAWEIVLYDNDDLAPIREILRAQEV